MKTKEKKSKCLVEVFVLEKELISFDCGNFVILIIYNPEKGENLFRAYFGSDYSSYFMAIAEIDLEHVKSIEIDLNAFRRIKQIYRRCDHIRYSMELWHLLEENFSKHMNRYCGDIII